MIVEKILVVSIDIVNILTLSHPDTVLAMLRTRYEGRCFGACRILEVLEIVARGIPIIQQTDSRKVAVLSCKILVRGIEYIAGEVIHGCTVVNANESAINASAKFAAIFISADRIRGVTAGMTISVEVIESRFNVTDQTICVNAKYFMPITFPKYMRITGTMTECVSRRLMEDLASARSELSATVKADKGAVEGFDRVLGPNNGQKVAGKVITVDKILETKSAQDMWVAIDPSMGIASQDLVVVDVVPDNVVASMKISRNIDDTLAEIVMYKRNCLEALARFPTIYAGDALSAHKKLWFIHRRNHEKPESMIQ